MYTCTHTLHSVSPLCKYLPLPLCIIISLIVCLCPHTLHSVLPLCKYLPLPLCIDDLYGNMCECILLCCYDGVTEMFFTSRLVLLHYTFPVRRGIFKLWNYWLQPTQMSTIHVRWVVIYYIMPIIVRVWWYITMAIKTRHTDSSESKWPWGIVEAFWPQYLSLAVPTLVLLWQ